MDHLAWWGTGIDMKIMFARRKEYIMHVLFIGTVVLHFTFSLPAGKWCDSRILQGTIIYLLSVLTALIDIEKHTAFIFRIKLGVLGSE